MMMVSVEDQETSEIFKRFNISKNTSDPEVDYYINPDFSPTKLLNKLTKNLAMSEIIFEMRYKIEYVTKIADLLCFIRRSFMEHLSSIYPRIYVERKLF